MDFHEDFVRKAAQKRIADHAWCTQDTQRWLVSRRRAADNYKETTDLKDWYYLA